MDADGVFVDFIGGVLRETKALTGRNVAREALVNWDIFSDIERITGHEGLKDLLVEHVDAPGFCSALEPCSGAEEGLKRLLELDKRGIIHLAIVTTPWQGSPTWAHERTRWFTRRGLPVERVMHAVVKRAVYGDIFVDDKPSHVREWAARHHNQDGQAFLWPCSHNVHETSLPRLRDWDHLIDAISARAVIPPAGKSVDQASLSAVTVHLCDWSGQPDIHIACSETWTMPRWFGANTDLKDVYRSEDDRLYAFDREKVTCKKCKDAPPYVAPPHKR